MKKLGNYQAPESLEDVTIGQLLALQTMTPGGDLEHTIEAVKIFNPAANVMAGNFTELIETATAIHQLISQAPVAQETKSYTIDDQLYNIVNPDELEVGEFIDVNTLNDDQDKIKNLPLIISLLTKERPMDVKPWAEKVRDNVSVLAAVGILSFFSEALTNYIVATPYYSEVIGHETTKKRKGKE